MVLMMVEDGLGSEKGLRDDQRLAYKRTFRKGEVLTRVGLLETRFDLASKAIYIDYTDPLT